MCNTLILPHHLTKRRCLDPINESYYVSLRSELRVVMSVTISTWKRCSVRLYLQLFVGGLMSYLRYLGKHANSGAKYILCCGFFTMFSFVLCTLCCQFPWLTIFDFPFDIRLRLFTSPITFYWNVCIKIATLVLLRWWGLISCLSFWSIHWYSSGINSVAKYIQPQIRNGLV